MSIFTTFLLIHGYNDLTQSSHKKFMEKGIYKKDNLLTIWILPDFNLLPVEMYNYIVLWGCGSLLFNLL